MSFFNKINSILFENNESRSASTPVKYVDNVYGFGQIKTGGNFQASKPELTSSVYTAINIIANTVSKLDLNIYQKTKNGKVLALNHSWYNAIKYQPDNLSTNKWLAFALTKMYLEGNSFFFRNDQTNKLQSLNDLERYAFLEGEFWYKFKNVNWLPQSAIIHFYSLSKDGGIGINPIDAIKSEMQIQNQSEQALMNFYENGLMSTLYLEADLEGAGIADKNKAKEYFDQLQTDFQGYKNSGKIPRIPPMYKIKSLPVAQIDYLANSKYTISQIASVFQIPPFYLGVQDGTNSYGKSEEQQIAFKNICLSNVCSIVSNELSNKILSLDERKSGLSIEFDFSNLYDIDIVTKANVATQLKNAGAISPNEIRQMFNLELIDNENMNYHYTQMQYVPLEKGLPTVDQNANGNNKEQEFKN